MDIISLGGLPLNESFAFRAIDFIDLVQPENILLRGCVKIAKEHNVVPYPIVRLTLKEMLASRTETAHFKLWPR